jgi:hypothetical protein
MSRQAKYRETTLAARRARAVQFVAEKADLDRLEQIHALTGASKTAAIRKALEVYCAQMEAKLG